MTPIRRIPDIDKLPDFNPAAVCPKCECHEVTVRYRTDVTFQGKRVEWLCRQCARCSYLWDERVRMGTPDDDHV